MKPERWRQIDQLYSAALERDPAARAAFLEEACRGDDSLRREIESLLESQASIDRFIESPAMEIAAKELAQDDAHAYPADLVGQTLAHFRIVEKLGAGGMGEVYRAEDMTLGRHVALKALPDAFAGDSERSARFEREARVLASLNHPNIASIHGLEQAAGKRFLVLELAEGETLAQKIARGPLPLDETLEVCRQIAEGLEAAHEHGIIHRDLKPANVKVTPEGMVKILDFGLAKAFQGESSGALVAPSPTLTAQTTCPGTILGTAAYMSPEQAKGNAVDKRTDIWAFGCLLYECLAGRRAFKGEMVTEILASILKGEPDWEAIPAATPRGLNELVRRCLRKDHRERLRDIGDARIEIAEVLKGSGGIDLEVSGSPAKMNWRPAVYLALATISAIAAALLGWHLHPSPSKQLFVGEIGVEPARQLGGIRPVQTEMALFPDGNSLVFTGVAGQNRQLYLRRMERRIAEPIAGTMGASQPFLSPDGQWVGFYAEGKLRKLPISGGTPKEICATEPPRGISWSADNRIFFATDIRLWCVSASGGNPKTLVQADRGKNEFEISSPHVLPGGAAVLFSIRTANSYWPNPRTELLDLKTLEHRTLLEEGGDARYASSGHLVFMRQGTLCAVPFDPVRLEITGEIKPLIEDVMQAINGMGGAQTTYAGQFSFSSSGTLAYVSGGANPDLDWWLVWIDRNGETQPLLPSSGPYHGGRISPDHRRAAYHTIGKNWDICVVDLDRGVPTPLVRGGVNWLPIWTRDSRSVTFMQSGQAGRRRIMSKPVDGRGEAECLIDDDSAVFPSSWSPEGDLLAYIRREPDARREGGNQYDIWTLRIADREQKPFLNTPANETNAEFSPDGRWLAYVSDESGNREVWVASFPGKNQKIKVTQDGGSMPHWSPDMSRLLYLSGSYVIMEVELKTEPKLWAGSPRTVLDFPLFYYAGIPVGTYDVYPDGKRFLTAGLYYGVKAIRASDIPEPFRPGLSSFDPQTLTWMEHTLRARGQPEFSKSFERFKKGMAITQIHIIQNWFEELKRLVPAAR